VSDLTNLSGRTWRPEGYRIVGHAPDRPPVTLPGPKVDGATPEQRRALTLAVVDRLNALTGPEQKTLDALVTWYAGGQPGRPTFRWLVKSTGLVLRTVQLAVDRLESLGYVTRPALIGGWGRGIELLPPWRPR
jgi:hypothetical protein